jgi:hypothetical protein
MPGGDRTGPLGRGPMTGRALGYCTGSNMLGYATPGFGRGFGRGGGRGLGRRWGRGRGFWWRGYSDPYYYQQPYMDVYPQPTKEEEKTYLESMIKSLEEEIKMIKERLQKISKEKKEGT